MTLGLGRAGDWGRHCKGKKTREGGWVEDRGRTLEGLGLAARIRRPPANLHN